MTTISRLTQGLCIIVLCYGLKDLRILIAGIDVILILITGTEAGTYLAKLLTRLAEAFESAAKWIMANKQGPGPPTELK